MQEKKDQKSVPLMNKATKIKKGVLNKWRPT